MGEHSTRDLGAAALAPPAGAGGVEGRCTSLTPQHFRNFVVRAACSCGHGRDLQLKLRTQELLPGSPDGASLVEFMSVHQCMSCCSGSQAGAMGAKLCLARTVSGG